MLGPVERKSLSDQVFNQLRNGILSNAYTPGERLPSERELCEVLKVNRSSVREGLKRLEQARLIEIRHGSGSVVLDFRLNAGFELLGDLIAPAAQVNRVAVRSILEFRALIGPEIARLAALRIQASELSRLDELVGEIEGSRADEVATLQDLDFQFHHTMARASENLALLLIVNSVKDVYFKMKEAFAAMFETSRASRAIYRSIVQALRAGDSGEAAKLCSSLMQIGNQRLLDLLDGLNATEGNP